MPLSETEVLFKKQIRTKFASIVLISHFDYSKYTFHQFELYCTSSDYTKIFGTNMVFYTLNVEQLLTRIQENISQGIFLLVTENALFKGGALFDSSLSWTTINNELVISNSSTDIALFLNLPISKSALAVSLIHSLPYYPFQNISLWENVETITPFHILKYKANGEVENIKIWSPPSIQNEVDSIYLKIRKRLLELLSNSIASYVEISADLSGGVDSATIVYILKALQADIKLYHANADSEWNSDYKWANLISNDIDIKLTSLSSLGSSGRNFEVDMEYYNFVLPDSPLFWADTEGYVETIEKMTINPTKSTHFTGLGGDELFTPMPSDAWSLVRQNKLRSIELGLRYCLLNRIPLLTGSVKLINNSSFKEAVRQEIESGFGYTKKVSRNSELNWCGQITVPNWLLEPYRKLSYGALVNKLDTTPGALDLDRSRHQMIESLLFQKSLLKQVNKIYGVNGIVWQAPLLDIEIIKASLTIPVRYRQSNDMTKSILYNATKGLVSKNIFTRGFKGDYSESLYKSYKSAAREYSNKIRQFKLVEFGIIDADIIESELSMPTALHNRIEAFERLTAVERWVRAVLKKKAKKLVIKKS